MIFKVLKYFRVTTIDVLIYSMNSDNLFEFNKLDLKIENEVINKSKKRYYVTIDGKMAHESFLFKKIFLLRLINKNGPTIGNCKTKKEFKGKSIYPFVINHIAQEEIVINKKKEVFIIVNSNNVSSIKGIEKAGFKLLSSIKAKRFLLFYFNKEIKRQ